MEPGHEQLLTMRQVARHLCVSERTIQRLIRTGVFAATRIGKQVRIAASSVPGYLGTMPNDPALAEPAPRFSPFQEKKR